MISLERYIACMEYQAADGRPNHEFGVWVQTKKRWQKKHRNPSKTFNDPDLKAKIC